MSSQGYEEELLLHWFPANAQLSKRTRFSETDIRGITDVLRTVENGAWSRIPRIYIVLRLIGRLEAIGSFVQHECSDTWFPFTQRNLPDGLREPSERSGFLEAQQFVCNTKALNLERADSPHGHFPDPNEIPLRKIGELGKGGSGFVDRVISTVSHREYALKLIKRGQTFRKNKQVLHNFERELASLKRLSKEHKHIIDLVGSYTDPKFVGILFPVADCDLTAFMISPDISERQWTIRSYFGCLTSALAFLHENNIRHKDIKPQNILIKQDVPYFTDFGLAVDWTDLGHSTTLGPTAMTPRYSAPEVAACEARNSSADIWSLGCVFLEMWAVLKGASVEEVSSFTYVDGRLLPYHSKDTRLSELLDHIAALPGSPSDLKPRIWIQSMLHRERHDRWPAQVILEHIRELGDDHTTQYLYVGRCCMGDEDTAESVISYAISDREDVQTPEAQTVRAEQNTISETSISSASLTQPLAVRPRQSIQIMDLQAQVNQLSAQNRALEEAKHRAEQSLYAAQTQQHVDTVNTEKNDPKTSSVNGEAYVTSEGDSLLSHQTHSGQITSGSVHGTAAARNADINLSPFKKQPLRKRRDAFSRPTPGPNTNPEQRETPQHLKPSGRELQSAHRSSLVLTRSDEQQAIEVGSISNSSTLHGNFIDRDKGGGEAESSMRKNTGISVMNDQQELGKERQAQASRPRPPPPPPPTTPPIFKDSQLPWSPRQRDSADLSTSTANQHDLLELTQSKIEAREQAQVAREMILAREQARKDFNARENTQVAQVEVEAIDQAQVAQKEVETTDQARVAGQRAISTQREIAQLSKTLVEGQERVRLEGRSMHSQKISLPPPRRLQSYSESSTEAYSSLSDTPRTSKPRTKARTRALKRTTKAPERKSFFESVIDRLRPDQDKPKVSRREGKEVRIRDRVPQSQGSAKPLRTIPDVSYSQKGRKRVVPVQDLSTTPTDTDTEPEEIRPKRKIEVVLKGRAPFS